MEKLDVLELAEDYQVVSPFPICNIIFQDTTKMPKYHLATCLLTTTLLYNKELKIQWNFKKNQSNLVISILDISKSNFSNNNKKLRNN